MDYLTTQAPEILALIFKEVRQLNGEHQMAGVVSKALLPYTRQNLYHDVVLDSYDQVEQFTSSVDSRLKGNKNGELLGSLVESLYVKIWPEESREGQLSRPAGLFINLKNVKKVTIERSMHLSRTILLPKVAEKCLPKLESLALLELGGFHVCPLDPKCWSSLTLYKSLHTLEINLCYGSSFDEDESGLSLARHGANSENATQLSHITSLKLGGDLRNFSDELEDLMSLFENLKSLELEGGWEMDAFQAIFAHSMPNLEELSISHKPDGVDSEDDSAQPSSISITSELKMVPNVALLILGDGVHGAATLKAVCDLKKLEKIIIKDDKFISPLPSLESLLNPAVRPPQLKSLTLDHSKGTLGEDFTHLDEVPSAKKMGWKLPKWRKEGDYENVQYLIKKASEYRFDLNGTLIEAAGVQLEWDRQKKVVEDKKMVLS